MQPTLLFDESVGSKTRSGLALTTIFFRRAGNELVRLGSCSMASQQAVDHHVSAASHLRTAADFNERAAEHYSHGDHQQAAHFALLAHAHMQHAGQFMSDAAKIHAELHGVNKHTLIG